MSHWKLITVATLSLLPIVLFAGFGAYSLWESGRWFWLWWTLPVFWGLSSLLYRRWRTSWELPVGPPESPTWTERDRAATAIIVAEQQRIGEIPAEKLRDPQFYTQVTQDLALKIAQHYHPHANDPLGPHTVVEVLAAAQLISEDLEEWFLKTVPGSHLVTVGQWRLLSQAPGWWQMASQAGWVASIALNPLNIGRYLVSRVAVDPLTQQLQQNILGSFYTIYVRLAGYYLIELNSGRLQGGSKRYRELMRRISATEPVPASGESSAKPAATPAPGVPERAVVTVAIVGQVKAGKSSLCNCLLGGQHAVSDILPATRDVARYTLKWPGRGEELVLLDTPGYSESGATAEQVRETREAAREADLLLLVLDVRSPARDADVRMLRELREWFEKHPAYRWPRVVVVLNKIDGLSPVLEWSPPYAWRSPRRPKEQSIAAALAYAREVFGSLIVDAIPVCADHDHQRVHGVDEDLIPAMSGQLDDARATALLRALHVEIERQKVRRVLGQVVEAGKRLLDSADLLRGP